MENATDRYAEIERLKELARLDVLDTAAEPLFDGLVKLASVTFRTPIALISLVADDRQWFKSCIGLEVSGTSRDVAFCDYAIRGDDVMVVLDATADPRFCNNPLVTGDPKIRFYAGAPLITARGYKIGTLCLIDPRSRDDFTAQEAAQLRAMANAVMQGLVMRSEARAAKEIAIIAEDRHRLLVLAEQMAGVGTWSWDVATNETRWSREVYNIHGFDASKPPPDLAGVLGLYSPSDAERLGSMVELAVAEGRDYELEATIIRPDGQTRQILAKGSTRRNSAGVVEALMGTFQDITHLRLADQALKDSESRYRRIADNASDLVTEAALDGCFTYASPAIEKLTGYTADEVIGRNALEFVHPDDRERIAQELPAALASTSPVRLEYRHVTKDGRTIWIEARPSLSRDRVSGRALAVTDVIRDITSSKIAGRALEESEARFRQIAENSTDIIALYTADGIFTYVSPSVHSAIGYTPEELIGRRVADFIHRDDLARVYGKLAKFISEGSNASKLYYDYRATAKDGTLVWLEAHPVKIFDPATGELTGFQDVVRVVTDRKIYEAEIQEARDAAVAATRAKSDFVANMSHEIRTPLTAILGFASLLSDRTDLPETANLYVRRIGTATTALKAIVNDILDFSKIEAGELTIRPERLKTGDFVRETVMMFASQADGKSLWLDVQIDNSTPEAVSVDPDRLRQVVINLVGNGIKFTDRGGITVGVRYDKHAQQLQFTVTDTGMGLEPDQCANLFRRFSQVDMSSTRRHGGTGLGLAICRGLTEAMGGSIDVTSRVGVGTTFAFCVSAPECTKSDPVPTETVHSNALEGLRVLIADDNQHVRELAVGILETVGAEITEVSGPEDCLNFAASLPFDVILLDWRMPVLDGPSVLKMIRSVNGPNRDTPIVAFTAETISRRDLSNFGFDGFVGKPISSEQLIRSIVDATAHGVLV